MYARSHSRAWFTLLTAAECDDLRTQELINVILLAFGFFWAAAATVFWRCIEGPRSRHPGWWANYHSCCEHLVRGLCYNQHK